MTTLAKISLAQTPGRNTGPTFTEMLNERTYSEAKAKKLQNSGSFNSALYTATKTKAATAKSLSILGVIGALGFNAWDSLVKQSIPFASKLLFTAVPAATFLLTHYFETKPSIVNPSAQGAQQAHEISAEAPMNPQDEILSSQFTEEHLNALLDKLVYSEHLAVKKFAEENQDRLGLTDDEVNAFQALHDTRWLSMDNFLKQLFPSEKTEVSTLFSGIYKAYFKEEFGLSVSKEGKVIKFKTLHENNEGNSNSFALSSDGKRVLGVEFVLGKEFFNIGDIFGDSLITINVLEKNYDSPDSEFERTDSQQLTMEKFYTDLPYSAEIPREKMFFNIVVPSVVTRPRPSGNGRSLEPASSVAV